jgi:AcrR family transcriptional regulator
MTHRDDKILQAAFALFSRYGVKRSTMNDIAQEAGIARQTLYNAFANKDEVLCGIIRLYREETTAELEAVLEATDDPAARFAAYLKLAVIKPYQMLCQNPNLEDFLEGFNAAGIREIEQTEEAMRGVLRSVLTPYAVELATAGHDVSTLAEFLHQSAISSKGRAKSPEHLQELTATLTRIFLALIGVKTP